VQGVHLTRGKKLSGGRRDEVDRKGAREAERKLSSGKGKEKECRKSNAFSKGTWNKADDAQKACPGAQDVLASSQSRLRGKRAK